MLTEHVQQTSSIMQTPGALAVTVTDRGKGVYVAPPKKMPPTKEKGIVIRSLVV